MTIAQQQAAAKQQQFLTVEQFSLLTQYHPKHIYRMIAQGKIDVFRCGGRGIRIPYPEARRIRAQHPNADQMLSL